MEDTIKYFVLMEKTGFSETESRFLCSIYLQMKRIMKAKKQVVSDGVLNGRSTAVCIYVSNMIDSSVRFVIVHFCQN